MTLFFGTHALQLFTAATDARQKLEDRISENERLVAELFARLGKFESQGPAPALISRIEDLEIWRAKMHKLLTDTSPLRGTEKLSKMGRGLRSLYDRH